LGELPPLSVGTAPFSVATGDFNGDGNLDVVTANYPSNDVSVLMGKGSCQFAAQVAYSVGTYPRVVTVADVNRDAKPDIIVAHYTSKDVSVLINQGDSSFTSAVSIANVDNP
jgi:hypothetical protein